MVVIYYGYDYKFPNIPRINKLRMINIYKLDYNLLLKLCWPKLSTQHAEVTDNLGENRRRYKRNCSADNIDIIDIFITEVQRLTFRNILKLQIDAKGCLDQISNSHTILHFHHASSILHVFLMKLREMGEMKQN